MPADPNSQAPSDTFAEPPSQLTEEVFVQRFGALYEHSPWLARETWRRGLTRDQDNIDGLARAFAHTLAGATDDQQLALIRAHPDLAGRAAVRGELTAESTGEQASAGLDQCSAEELQRFQTLNSAYLEKFGFPFVMAVRGRDRYAILAAFEERLLNDPATEFQRALEEINAIARLRLQALASATTDHQAPGHE